jgi:membrane-associated protease RseP (regulator of RpoE activity)
MVAGGTIVVMDVAKVRASVHVDMLVAASPGAPANAPPVAPVLVAKVGTFSSLDAFAAVQPMQLQALKQADRHDDTEETANDDPQTSRSEDPRWRVYKTALDSVRPR